MQLKVPQGLQVKPVVAGTCVGCASSEVTSTDLKLCFVCKRLRNAARAEVAAWQQEQLDIERQMLMGIKL